MIDSILGKAFYHSAERPPKSQLTVSLRQRVDWFFLQTHILILDTTP